MSTFHGVLADRSLQFIAIDCFEKNTYSCNVFLLSHHHLDHMKGLFETEFSALINDSTDKFLYCSPLTSLFLVQNFRCGIKKDRIVILEIGKSHLISHTKPEVDVAVSSLPAGHCPGSVMFLLEYQNKRILYTGDFRMNLQDFKLTKNRLTNSDGSIIPINDLYLDTTFAIPSKFNDFPSREHGFLVIAEMIQKWLSSKYYTPNKKIVLLTPAKYGSEYLYLNLYKRFKKPISVHSEVFDCYSYIEEMAGCIVPFNHFQQYDNDDWIIHACGNKNFCPVYTSKDSKIIKPCAYGFLIDSSTNIRYHDKYKVPYIKVSERVFKIFYSSHCSLNELKEIVDFIRPERLFINVKHKSFHIKDILALLQKTDDNNNTDVSEEKRIQECQELITIAKIKKVGDSMSPSSKEKFRKKHEQQDTQVRKMLKLDF